MEEKKTTPLKALFKQLLPALKTKRHEMVLCGFHYVTNEDIFNFIKNNNWKHTKQISLNEMVSDILNSSHYDIINFLNRNTKKTKIDLPKEEKTLL